MCQLRQCASELPVVCVWTCCRGVAEGVGALGMAIPAGSASDLFQFQFLFPFQFVYGLGPWLQNGA